MPNLWKVIKFYGSIPPTRWGICRIWIHKTWAELGWFEHHTIPSGQKWYPKDGCHPKTVFWSGKPLGDTPNSNSWSGLRMNKSADNQLTLQLLLLQKSWSWCGSSWWFSVKDDGWCRQTMDYNRYQSRLGKNNDHQYHYKHILTSCIHHIHHISYISMFCKTTTATVRR